MPEAKSGTAGSLESPSAPADAQDALDDQAGVSETAPTEGTDRGAQTFSMTSVTSNAEQTTDDSDDDSDDTGGDAGDDTGDDAGGNAGGNAGAGDDEDDG
jgi:hypothetical protein